MTPPLAILLELTHRCPLQCPYCSNPLALTATALELPTEVWERVIAEAAELGVLQAHFSGGEPAARGDLETLIAAAARAGLYTNLITSGVGLKQERLLRLAAAGLDHVQISLQDVAAANADRIAGFAGAYEKKRALAAAVRAAGLPLTLNAVMHRQNIGNVGAMIALAVDIGAGRLELAHVQYYGWALANRAALMPKRAELAAALKVVEEARERLRGTLVIDHVVPDYYAERPKACMGGWGRRFLVVDPAGDVLPCHAAKSIPHLRFDNVAARSLRDIWDTSEAFAAYRGTGFMSEPCRSCPRAEIDWGGCRCQAFALTGRAEATDPACGLSPDHGAMRALAEADAGAAPPALRYRRFDG